MENLKKTVRVAALICALLLPRSSGAEQRGVINDPDGFVNLRASKSGDAAIIGKVKAGEVFRFTCADGDEWCSVKLASGRTGSMHRSRIRLHFTEKDLPKPPKKSEGLSEIDEVAQRLRLDYAAVVRKAARGEEKALQQLFEIAKDVDGAAAESFRGTPTIVYHMLGDAKFAQFVAAQPITDRMYVRNVIVSDDSLADQTYLQRHFPATTKELFPREIVGWPSPDGRFAIRKVFSEEALFGSKVARAEVIERADGKVLADLTASDIGTSADREGEIFWGPDSKRFAMLSSDPTLPGNLFETPPPKPQRKQTAVYELAGDTFVLVDLGLGEPPGRFDDVDVAAAKLGHKYVEPLRWNDARVLVLQRHEYFQMLKPRTLEGMAFESIHDFDRMYEITVTFSGDDKPDVVWKEREDPP